MYKLETKEDRRAWLTSRKLCFKCGSKFQRLHRCDWRGVGKFYTQCNKEDCRNAAVTCRDHDKNLSPELKNWLKISKLDIKHLTQIAIYSPGKLELIDMSYLRFKESINMSHMSLPIYQQFPIFSALSAFKNILSILKFL